MVLKEVRKRLILSVSAFALAAALVPASALAAPDGEPESGGDSPQRDWSTLPTVEELGSMRAVAVEVSSSHYAAIGEDGSLWTWGDNTYGQLGDGTRESSDKPLKVMENVAEVAVEGPMTFALKKDGTLWSWGQNWGALLGDGRPADDYDSEVIGRTTPEKILDGVAHVPSVSQGMSNYNGAVAVKEDGTLWYWGNDLARVELAPVKVMDGVAAAESGYSKDGPNYVALKNDGSVWTWGHSGLNSLGRGDANSWEYFAEPAKVLDDVKRVIPGSRITLALKNDSSLWMWGEPGERSNRHTSVPAKVYDGVIDAGSANGYHSYMYALSDGGDVLVWGDGPDREDVGSTGELNYVPGEPHKVLSSAKQAQCADGNGTSIVLKADGTLWTWGSNRYGQLGDGATAVGDGASREEPAQILSGIESFSTNESLSGSFTSAAVLDTDGAVWTWGSADDESNVPRKVLLPDTRPAADPDTGDSGSSAPSDSGLSGDSDGSGSGSDDSSAGSAGNGASQPAQPAAPAAQPQSMHRLYNPHSGEHFYTADEGERDAVAAAGWKYEGVGWTAPETSGTPVYRLYNKHGGEHHYTTDEGERDALVAAGWAYEGIGWYSDDAKSVPLYREYNPNAFANNHNYTTDKDEHEWLLSLGWRDEGYAWYGVE